jgi:hypothetical protein
MSVARSCRRPPICTASPNKRSTEHWPKEHGPRHCGGQTAVHQECSPKIRWSTTANCCRLHNDCWQFDLSPSDLKEVKEPLWLQPNKGSPALMLFSVLDDRSSVAYQEYRCVYGEDVEAALRFLFNAMSPKQIDGFPFQGIPKMIYLDNGPIAKSHVFQQVMRYLGIDVCAHLPQGKDGRRATSRSKGKVERPFRTVKEMHETLYHFHEPKDEEEANAWLVNFLLRYNAMQHRSEPHSRIEDWLENLPPSGVRAVCSWERFCTFAREPERRKVGGDARVSVDGVNYEVDPDLAGETVILWWGIFDNELYVEHDDKRFGPYAPVGGPIPLYRCLTFKKTRTQERADRIESLAEQLVLPRAALEAHPHAASLIRNMAVPVTMFTDLDPFQEIALFYDLAIEKDFKIPTQPERRERALSDLIRKRQRPIALFIDDAHDLHSKTLIGLKRLIQVVGHTGGTLSVVLAGHPKLKNDLRQPSMEETGSRAIIFELEASEARSRGTSSGCSPSR